MTTDHVAACRYDESDTLRIHPYLEDVRIVSTGTTVYLTPRKARKLAKALKKAAKQAERAAEEGGPMAPRSSSSSSGGLKP